MLPARRRRLTAKGDNGGGPAQQRTPLRPRRPVHHCAALALPRVVPTSTVARLIANGGVPGHQAVTCRAVCRGQDDPGAVRRADDVTHLSHATDRTPPRRAYSLWKLSHDCGQPVSVSAAAGMIGPVRGFDDSQATVRPARGPPAKSPSTHRGSPHRAHHYNELRRPSGVGSTRARTKPGSKTAPSVTVRNYLVVGQTSRKQWGWGRLR